MTLGFTAAAAFLLLGAATQQSATSSSSTVKLEAKRLDYQLEQKFMVGAGNARMSMTGTMLHADVIEFSEKDNRADAKGNVSLALTQGGLYASVAERVVLLLDGDVVTDVFIENGHIYKKKGVTAQALLAAGPDEIVDTGVTSIVLSGNHLKRTGEDKWVVDNMAFTPCDCNQKEPSWSIRSFRSTIDLNADRAFLWSPLVYVREVPVFWFPALSLPLTERQTGVLVPMPAFGGLNGFSIDVPVFFTLGRSMDLTLTPGYFGGGDIRTQGVKGPRLNAEFRYVPSEDIEGIVSGGIIYDTKEYRDPVSRGLLQGATDPKLPRERGLRGHLNLTHSQDLGADFHNQVNASLVSDGYYVSDLTADVRQSETEYLRSTAAIYHRGVNDYVGLDVAIRQDLRQGYSLFDNDKSLFDDSTLHGPNTIQRLPALVAAIPPTRLLGPIQGSFRGEFVQHTGLFGKSGDEGISANEGRPTLETGELITSECLHRRLFYPAPALRPGAVAPVPAGDFYCPAGVLIDKTGQADRAWQEGERQARLRLDLNPRLSAALPLGKYAVATPYASYRQDVYYEEVTGQTSTRGYPLAGVALETEFGRTYGDNRNLRHSIVPTAEFRYAPAPFGTDPSPYDDIDTAMPVQGLTQMYFEIRQKLARRNTPGAFEALRLDLGQGLNLKSPTFAKGWSDTYARLSGQRGYFDSALTVRYDPVRDRFTQISADASLNNGKGEAASISWDKFFGQGTDRMRQPIDALMGLPPIEFGTLTGEQISFGLRSKLGAGFSANYDALIWRQRYQSSLWLDARNPGVFEPAAAGTVRTEMFLAQQRLAVAYAPACDCWRVEAYALHSPGGDHNYVVKPDFGITVTVSNFGTFGTPR